jgi:hypothetical protein
MEYICDRPGLGRGTSGFYVSKLTTQGTDINKELGSG